MFPPQMKKVSPKQAMFPPPQKKNVRSAEILCVRIFQLNVQCHVVQFAPKGSSKSQNVVGRGLVKLP